MADRCSQIREIIVDGFPEIFPIWVADKNYLGSKIKIGRLKEGYQITLPDTPQIFPEKGLPLEDDVGYITIQEEIKEKSVVGYVYRFTTCKYFCEFLKDDGNKSSGGEWFSFHYDKDEDDNPHPPHLTVVLRAIRYISRDITLEEFLEFIRKHFFEPSTEGKYKRKKGDIWASRF